MKLLYRVHSVVDHVFQVAAKTAGGRDVIAPVTGLCVELIEIGEDGKIFEDGHGHTFRLLPESDEALTALRALYAIDNEVSLIGELVKAAPVVEAPLKGDGESQTITAADVGTVSAEVLAAAAEHAA